MLKYTKGDLFLHVAAQAVLAHACNPFGLWGGGIAAQFQTRYPSAYEQYARVCREHARDPASLLGTCLVVRADHVYIACLFTSDFHSLRDEILNYTRQSVLHLARQVAQLPGLEPPHLPVVNMPKINSGIFNVPWEDTERILGDCPSLLFNVYTI